jgi:hypothetical protein
VFPALTYEQGEPAKKDAEIEDVLCKNKMFFPTFEESQEFYSKGQFSKAVVLVLNEEEIRQ